MTALRARLMTVTVTLGALQSRAALALPLDRTAMQRGVCPHPQSTHPVKY